MMVMMMMMIIMMMIIIIIIIIIITTKQYKHASSRGPHGDSPAVLESYSPPRLQSNSA